MAVLVVCSGASPVTVWPALREAVTAMLLAAMRVGAVSSPDTRRAWPVFSFWADSKPLWLTSTRVPLGSRTITNLRGAGGGR